MHTYNKYNIDGHIESVHTYMDTYIHTFMVFINYIAYA